MKTQTLIAAAVATFGLVGANSAAAREPLPTGEAHRSCIDEACTLLSLHGLEGMASAGASGAGVNGTASPKYGSWGFDTAGMNSGVKPGDSFNGFANGKAVEAMVIPADRTAYGSFQLLAQLSENRSKALIESLASSKGLKPKSDEAKIAAVYSAFMDEARIEALDAQPLAPTLKAIRDLKTKADVTARMGASLGSLGVSVVGAYISDDAKNPRINSLYMSQSGLGLADRDFYLKPEHAERRDKYQQYIARLLKEAGWAEPEAAAQAVMAFETQIAQVHWSRIESRNRDKTYNPVTIAELPQLAPGIDWPVFLKAAGLGQAKAAILTQNTAVVKLAALYGQAEVETLKAWLAFHAVDDAAPLLSKRFADTHWEFRSKFLQGQQEQRPRWARAITAVEGGLGEALGRSYVKAYFPAESKAKMEKLVADIKAAMKARLENLSWMSPPTKAIALEKLSKFGVKIGYPEKWRDYATLRVKADDAFGNAQAIRRYFYQDRLARLGKPVDRKEWGMTPQTVNAYYSATRNEIVFPAAILQAPFFDPDADPAVNYGGIGGVIGHEIVHGFDDQGRKSDGDGVRRDWWQPEDAAQFEAQAKKLGAQYDTYEPLPGVFVQGSLSMGENIADLGGVLLALDAYKLSLAGKPAPVLDGFTGEQRVMLGWAQVWRSKARDAAVRQQVVTGPHSPPMFRVIGPVRNVDAWYDAFGVKPEDKFYVKPEDRVRIW
jgi:putative endopeptidase